MEDMAETQRVGMYTLWRPPRAPGMTEHNMTEKQEFYQQVFSSNSRRGGHSSVISSPGARPEHVLRAEPKDLEVTRWSMEPIYFHTHPDAILVRKVENSSTLHV